MPIKDGKAVYKDFGACVAAQKRKGKSPESARKICGFLQSRQEGGPSNASSQLPEDIRPHYNRSVKTLDFLKQQGVLAEDESVYESQDDNDTSFDNQQSTDNIMSSIYRDPESYTDKVTRLMDEYKISEEDAKEIVGNIIENQQIEIDRRQYELMKQIQLEQQSSQQSDQQSEQQPEQPVEQEQENVGEQQEQEQTSDDSNSPNQE